MIHRFMVSAIENYKARIGKSTGNEKSKNSRKNKSRFGIVKMGGGGKMATTALLAAMLFGGNAYSADRTVGTGGTYASIQALLNATILQAGDNIIFLNSSDNSANTMPNWNPANGVVNFQTATGGTTLDMSNIPSNYTNPNPNVHAISAFFFFNTNNRTFGLNNVSATPETDRLVLTGYTGISGVVVVSTSTALRSNNTLSFSGVDFVANRSVRTGANASGAGIVAMSTNNLKIDLDDVNFIDNRASASGTAIALFGGNNTLNISNSSFSGNRGSFNGGDTAYGPFADPFGGAVGILNLYTGVAVQTTTSYENHAISISDSNFTNNSIVSQWLGPNSLFTGSGGAFGLGVGYTDPSWHLGQNWGASTVNIAGTSFTGNTADKSGGAVLMWSYSNDASIATTLTNTLFDSNSVIGLSGGGAMSLGHNTTTTLGDGNVFQNNFATYKPGTLLDGSTTLVVAKSGDSSRGGAIILGDPSVTTDFTTLNITGAGNKFIGNVAEIINCNVANTSAQGGAIYVDLGSTVNIDVTSLDPDADTTTDFTGNEARNAANAGIATGGAIHNLGTLNLNSATEFSNNKVSSTTGTANGGAIYSTGTINATNAMTFTGNEADGDGGAIYSTGTITATDKVTFTDNEAGGRGGAIAMSGASAILNVNAHNFNQKFTGNSDSTGDNDIFLVNGAAANFDVTSGYNTFLAGGITDQFNATVGGNQQNLTKNGIGTLTFGAGSTSYLHGEVAINAGTFRLEYDNALERGGSFGYDTINNINVGNVNIANDVTISYQFAANGIDHTWIHGDTITIGDNVKFELDGVIWQPDARVIYNLAESRFDELGGTMDVTLNLDRGSFMTNKNVADRSGQTDPNVSKWLFRDFTYYVDDDGNFIKSYENGIHIGNIYAVEFLQIDEVIGVDPPYVDPSLKNRILSRRLDRCCKPIFCCPTDCDTGCSVDGCSDESITCRGQGIHSSSFQTSVRPHWNAWVEGYGTGGSVGNYNGRNGFDYSTGGMLVGIEKETADNHRLGFYYGYGSSWTTGRSISYNGKSENTFGGYLRIADELGYTLLMGNLGHNSYRSNRYVNGVGRDEYQANFGAFTSGAYLERGFDSRIASHSCLTPFVALQYSNLSTNWYGETPTTWSDIRLAQTAKLGYESLRTLVGARTQTMLRNRLNWNNSIHWEHELTKDGAVVRDEYLTNNTALSARTVGNYGGRDWVVYGTGLEFAVTPNMSLNAGYDLSFNKKATFHTGMGGMTYTF